VTAADLGVLLSVQDLDTSLDQHHRRRAGLQERAELAAMDARLAAAGERRAAAAARRDQVAARQDALERELGVTEARRAEINKRLYGGTVSATRDLQAMAAEVETLTARASGIEDLVYQVMEEREPFDAEVADIDRELRYVGGARAEVQGRLAAAEAGIDADIELVTGQRAEAAARVPADLLAVYEELRSRLGGVGAARLVGPRCSGCHLTLPATELDRLRKGAPDTLVFCDQCGRILIR
jgi:predicted  nucleic acid-binding Zn-ribbon protein